MWWRVAVAAALLGLGQVIVVAIVAAFRGRYSIYKVVLDVVIFGGAVVYFAAPLLVGEPLTSGGKLGVVLLSYAIGGFLFHFMTLPDRSVTLRILVELWLVPNGALSIEALDARYGVRGMIESRLRQLQDARWLEITPSGALVLTPRGERFGRLVAAGRRMFRIQSAN